MAEGQALTGVKKRQQIAGTRKQVFIWVALASAAVVVCLVVGINLFQRISYQSKVNSELGETDKVLKNSVSAIDGLVKSVNDLRANTALTLPNLKSDDSTVFQVVIDALPTEDDSVDLSSSLQNRILSRSGASIEQITIDSVGSSATSSSSSDAESDSGAAVDFPIAQRINFRISVVGGYDTIRSTVQDIERTIRPIIINEVTLNGSDNNLTATIDATTYYSPNVDYRVGSKEVPYEEE